MATTTLPQATAAAPRRTLATACGAHALHDGFTDLVTILLPAWQAAFGLAYAEVGALRSIYSAAMAGAQIPASAVAQRFGAARTLALATVLAGAGFALAALASGLVGLAVCAAITGLGASVQHPVAAGMVARAYEGARSRVALGTYNFAGDVGKVVLPALAAAVIALVSWRAAALAAGVLSVAGAVAIIVFAPADAAPAAAAPAADAGRAPAARGGFPLLVALSVIDSAARTGFLTFLPFLLTAKGAGMPTLGVALALVFAGGAAGKLICGWLGERLGVFGTVALTEGGTALGLLALLPLPLEASLALLVPIGVALNGTSSALYGTVPELVPPERRVRAFGILYTAGSAAGGVAPLLCGFAADAFGLVPVFVAVAISVLATLPLARALSASLPATERGA
jgi:MFS family permease